MQVNSEHTSSFFRPLQAVLWTELQIGFIVSFRICFQTEFPNFQSRYIVWCYLTVTSRLLAEIRHHGFSFRKLFQWISSICCYPVLGFFLNKCKENVFLNTIFIVMWFSVAKINLLLCKDASGLSYLFYWWKTLISRPSVLVITTVIKLISLGVPTCPSKVSHIVWLSMPMHNSKIKIWCL